jgi:hypothetical protein
LPTFQAAWAGAGFCTSEADDLAGVPGPQWDVAAAADFFTDVLRDFSRLQETDSRARKADIINNAKSRNHQ